MVPRSGTNLFRGSGSIYYGNDSIQADNVDADLRARGVDRASNLKSYFDGGFDLGGPILTDRLWFWGAYRYQEIERFVTGTRNADGSFPIDRTLLWYPTGKVNWQATPAHNASAFFNMQQKKRFNSGLSALRPLETTVNQQNDPISRVFSLRDDWVATPRLLVSFKGYYLKGAFRTTRDRRRRSRHAAAPGDVHQRVSRRAPPSLLRSFRQGHSAGVTRQLLGGRLRRPARPEVGLRLQPVRSAGRDDVPRRPSAQLLPGRTARSAALCTRPAELGGQPVRGVRPGRLGARPLHVQPGSAPRSPVELSARGNGSAQPLLRRSRRAGRDRRSHHLDQRVAAPGRHLRPHRLGQDAAQGQLRPLLLADLHDQDGAGEPGRHAHVPLHLERSERRSPVHDERAGRAALGGRPGHAAHQHRSGSEADIHRRVHREHRARADAQRVAERHVHRAGTTRTSTGASTATCRRPTTRP